MSYTYYPKTLPLPLQSGYSIKYAPSVLRTEMTDGTVRQRLLNVGAPATLTCSILLPTQKEYNEFMAFYKSINYGVEWFVMPLINENCDTENSIDYKLIRLQKGNFTCSLQFNNGNVCRQISITCDVDTLARSDEWRDYYNA